MTEWTMAYLMGPVVMLLVGVAIGIASRYHRKDKPQRPARWLDTHYADWLHHRH